MDILGCVIVGITGLSVIALIVYLIWGYFKIIKMILSKYQDNPTTFDVILAGITALSALIPLLYAFGKEILMILHG